MNGQDMVRLVQRQETGRRRLLCTRTALLLPQSIRGKWVRRTWTSKCGTGTVKGGNRGLGMEIWHEAGTGPGFQRCFLRWKDVERCLERALGINRRKKGTKHLQDNKTILLPNTRLALQAIEGFLCGSAVLKTSIYFVCLHD